MSGEEQPGEGPPPPERRAHRGGRGRWQYWLIGLFALLLAGLSAALLWIDTPGGHRFVAERIGALRPASGLRISVGRIEGSLWSKLVLRDLRLGDARGTALTVPLARLDWYPLGWLSNRLDIDRLAIPAARLERLPELKSTGPSRSILPGFDIRLASLSIGRLDLGAAVAGKPHALRAAGRMDVRNGRAIIHLDVRGLDSGDQLRLSLDSRPDDNLFDLEALAIAPKNGVLAPVSGIGRPFVARITGKGDYREWRGMALAAVAGGRASRLVVVQRSGNYSVQGTLESDILGQEGMLARLVSPRVSLDAHGRLDDRLLTGRVSAASGQIELSAKGGIDLARSAFDALVLDLRLNRGQRIIKDMTSEGLVVRARLSGPFAAASYDYLIAAKRADFGSTRIEGMRAEGSGRIDPKGTTVFPVELVADRVRVNNQIADELLRRIHVKGIVQIRNGVLTSTPIAVRSARIDGKLIVLADFGRGTWSAGFAGDIGGLEIPGLGRVDVASRVDAVKRSGGGGFTVSGRVRAIMRRLDNSFLRGLGGGLPQVETGLSLDPGGRIVFTDLNLTAPSIRLSANGYRARDGNFHFTAAGRHQSYGPMRVTLDGRIDRPQVDLHLASPMAALGLADVHAVLTPDAAGYRFTAQGGSRLGPFLGDGAILLPRGGDALIRVDRLAVAEAIASGQLVPRGGALAGQLDVGGAAQGAIRFAAVDGTQQIALNLALARVRSAGPPVLAIVRGQVKGTVLLKAGETSISGDFQAQGIRYGALVLGRVAASANLVNGRGAVTASANGRRGRQFTILARATVAPERIDLLTGGLLQNLPFSLDHPAVLTRADDGWRLAPVTLRYRGGTLAMSGELGGEATHAEARIDKLPLTLFDLMNPDLGLGGLATGTLRYDQPRGGVPTGAMQMTVRGLSRSGLALSSRPVDVGVNAALSQSRLAIRALVASGGKVLGRGQALVTPLGSARGLTDRLTPAPLNAQIRYAGDAGTLWRLTNIEMFDLSGEARLSATVRGTLADPLISGTVETDDASVQSPVTGMALAGVRSRGVFDGANLNFTEISARTPGGGSVRGSGRFTFSAERGVGIALSAQLERAQVLNRDDLGATVSGPVRITSSGEGGVIAGDFTVVSSRFTLGKAAAVASIPELKVIQVNRRGRELEASGPASPWQLDISADAPSRFEVTGLGMQSEWSMRVKIGGAVTSPRLTGTATLIRGDYDFAGRRFELREGELRFFGTTPINPTLNIRAVADVNDVNATIAITGTSAQPVINFTSVPALPQEELLSRLLFGTSITNLSAPEAIQLASAVGSLQGGGGLDPINAVRRAAGLSRLRILPADPTTGAKTAVAAGKNIGQRVYVELITDGQGYSATQIEYRITRWLSLLGSISTLGRQSASVRASKDY